MDITELRIGNLIERNGVTAKIELINNEIDEVYFIGDDFYYNDFCCNINPIPLTEEWLLKFSFTESISSYFLPISDEVDLIIDLYGNLTIGNINFYSQFYYVHQLQNLYFSLTQTELTLS